MRPFLTLHDPSSARRYYAAGTWQSDTFYTLMAGHAAGDPGGAALRDGRVSLSWQDLKRWVDGAAASFENSGLRAGDRVSLWMSNRAEAVVAFLACARQGYACNPSLHRTSGCADIAKLLGWLDTSILVTEPEWGAGRRAGDLAQLERDLPSLKSVLTPHTFPPPGGSPRSEAPQNPDSVVYLAFTSGTTGTPKCVMHSSNTILANARDMVRDWALGRDARLLTLSPLSHHIAWVAVGQWLVSGCQLIIDDPPRGRSRLDWILENETTYVMGVPTHAMDILAEQKRRGLSRMGTVRTFYMAGSPIPPTVAQAFVDQGIKPQNVYGMTENSSHQYTHPQDAPEVWVSTCGRGGGSYEVAIFDLEDTDKALPAGQTGQIAGRGAALMLGYFDNQAATEASFNRGGWFLSGDLGSLDAHGNLRIEGRLKDLIIRGGRNIYPAHIEALALRHPAVEKAAAFACPDERLGEKVCIAINGNVAADDLLSHLAAAGLSIYDLPEFFVRIDSFPLTASGKILKRELVAMTRRGELAPVPIRYVAR